MLCRVFLGTLYATATLRLLIFEFLKFVLKVNCIPFLWNSDSMSCVIPGNNEFNVAYLDFGDILVECPGHLSVMIVNLVQSIYSLH